MADNVFVEPDELARMTDALRHRGPDDQGRFVSSDRSASLGFRRLAIIDLAGGNQPIANEDGSIRLVCNGEIYNFHALRDELERAGHHFTTRGDIEPIVHLYEEHGVTFLNFLDGFFALALLDQRKGELILAVDRFGKKPLYTSVVRKRLHFASELKSLRSLGADLSVDYRVMIDYLRFGWIPAPWTAYRNVHKLGPGQLIHVHLEACRRVVCPVFPPTTYYHPPVGEFTGDYPSAQKQLHALLSEAVTKRLVADVPVGVLLSGGLDSAVVTALAARSSGTAVKTFTVGFEHGLYDERPRAALTARRFKTDHTELVVKGELDGMLDLVVTIFDEPFGDSSAIPTYLICRQAARHVKVVLTGDGGDESLAGYDRYRALAISSAIHALGFGSVGSVLERLLPDPDAELRSTRTRLWRLIRSLKLAPAQQYSIFISLYHDSRLMHLLGKELRPLVATRGDWIAQAIDGDTRLKSIVRRANLADYAVYLPYDLLVKIDRASMANGLEARSPFLDRQVVEFAVSLPLRWRTGLRFGKRILRDVFRSVLPREVLSAGKSGFGVPIGSWLRGPLNGQMEDRLGRKCLLVRTGLINVAAMEDLKKAHVAGKADHGQRLWVLMVLEEFLRRNA